MWETESGKLMLHMNEHRGHVTSILFWFVAALTIDVAVKKQNA
jgi:hypothetical protein